MSFPPTTVWQIKMPSWVSLQPVRQGSNLLVRVGKELRAIDLATGAEHWQTVVDPNGGFGHFLSAYGDLALSDRRPDPKHLTQVVGVRDGQIVLSTNLRCMVADGGTELVGAMLFAVGNDPATGEVLVGVDLASGHVEVDVSLASGADAVARAGNRLVVLNRMGSPGLYSLRFDGSDQQTIERRQAQDLKVSAGRLLVTLGDEDGNTRFVQARSVETLEELWIAPSCGPACGVDGDAAVHAEGTDGMWSLVLREAATGRERWRVEPQAGEMPGSIQFAANYVIITRTIGMTAYRRTDGQYIGEFELGRIAQVHDGRLYLGGFRALVCTNVG